MVFRGLRIASFAAVMLTSASLFAVTPNAGGDGGAMVGPVGDNPGNIAPAISASIDFAWNQTTTPNSWSLNTNWTPTAPVGGPDAAGLWVTVNTNITAATTINLFNTGDAGDAIKTIGRLDLGDTTGGSSFTIAAGTGGGSLDFNGNGSNAQLNNLSTSGSNVISAPVSLSSSLDVSNASANNFTISGAITGSGALNLSAGTLILSSTSNTYGGGTTLTGGKLSINGTATLGSGPLTLSGGTLVTTANRAVGAALPNNIVVTADSAITTTSNAATVGLPFTGSLTGTGGTLTIRNDGNSSPGLFDVTFRNGDNTMTRPIVIDNGANGGSTRINDFNTTGTTHTYSGVISGNGAYNRSATTPGTGGLTVFLADNTYTGTTTVHDGTLQLGNGGTTGSLSPTSTIQIDSGGTLRFDHTTGADFVQGTNFSSSAITGAGGIIKDGTASLTFNVANSFSGGLTINKGTVVSSVDGALGAGNVSLTAGNITLTLNGASNNIADSKTLSFVNTDTINLNNTSTDTVAGLVVDGVAQAPGIYGASALNPDGAFFGAGTITVVPEPATWGMMLLGGGLLTAVRRFRSKRV